MTRQTSTEERLQRPQAEDLLAVSSWSWHAAYYEGAWSLLDLPAAAAALGITNIECNDFMLPPPRLSRIRRPLLSLLPGAPPELWRYSRAGLRRLAADTFAHRVSILAWTVNSDFAAPAHRWPAQRRYLRRGLAAAQLLQAPLLRVNLGGSPATPRSRDEVIARRLAEFVILSQRYYPGVTVTVENHWGISTDIDRHLAIFDRANDRLQPRLRALFGCCFDPANMPDSSQRPAWWRELALRANHYHLKTTAFDAAGEDQNLPHAWLFQLLQEVGYRGKVTVEYAGDGPATEGVRQSASLFREYGAVLARRGSKPD
jgi:sugar phosphate isomerase/epimerase